MEIMTQSIGYRYNSVHLPTIPSLFPRSAHVFPQYGCTVPLLSTYFFRRQPGIMHRVLSLGLVGSSRSNGAVVGRGRIEESVTCKLQVYYHNVLTYA